ncbi:MAG: dTDP-4-dehydrorhamnose reductase [Bacteroidota bacterium]
MKSVLVTGANGQLGKCIHDAAESHEELWFYFADRAILDLDKPESVNSVFQQHNFDYCINTAAYTNVEKAESEKDAAFLTNAKGVKHLAEVCRENGTTLIHISTDYVFDGKKMEPYVEEDLVNAISVYGASKLKGEEYVKAICEKYFIVRTSWLYSQYGHNFLNSMLRFAAEGRDLNITTEQLGTPTNANDLAGAVLSIIQQNSTAYGLYHFSNKGSGTWYDFARAIFEYSGQLETVSLEKTEHYRTFAERPAYSILSKAKFSNTFNYPLVDWKESLKQLIENHK